MEDEPSIAELTRLAASTGDWGLVTILQHAIGGSSGAPVPFRYYGVGRWRDGRLVFVENHMEADPARPAFRRYTEADSSQPELAH